MISIKKIIQLILFTFLVAIVHAEDGHELWLRKVEHPHSVKIVSNQNSPTIEIAKQEINNAWLGKNGATVSLTIIKDPLIKDDGYRITPESVQANTDKGIIYGVYELVRRQQLRQYFTVYISNPSYKWRILNHWDNLDGSIERGYAGNSLFWRLGNDSLTTSNKDKKIWQEYARANASIGINASVLNNVNASPNMLSKATLQRVKDIADVLRPYGIKTFLSVNFASPKVIGKLPNADPLNPEVIKWWKEKAAEIYKIIPDFGGFLVKANSEGQPGPQDYKRTHAEGANMLADALKPFGGIIMWRAFVYSATQEDRARQAYDEFMPLDGKFRDNVIIQVKNGPIDFQPREPFSPLFGAMKKTPLMPELQITQEYLGHSEQLVFLSTMWEEFLKSDTYQEGEHSTIGRITDGSIFNYNNTAIAGVTNIGLDTNWCGHEFAQANWYAFGRLAWNNNERSGDIAEEWLNLTFQNNNDAPEPPDWQTNFIVPVKEMMLESREAAVNYSMPLGLHHIFAGDHHYGPGPWYAPNIRKDWTPPYYHQAAANGIGFDRTKSGSNAVNQYHEPLASWFTNLNTCPDAYLLWFHHLPWDYKMKDGHTLWESLCYHYATGLKQMGEFQKTWDKIESYVDAQRFKEVQSKLRRQYRAAQFWKDGCLLYFQQFSQMPIPYDIARPINDLNFYEKTDPLAAGY